MNNEQLLLQKEEELKITSLNLKRMEEEFDKRIFELEENFKTVINQKNILIESQKTELIQIKKNDDEIKEAIIKQRELEIEIEIKRNLLIKIEKNSKTTIKDEYHDVIEDSKYIEILKKTIHQKDNDYKDLNLLWQDTYRNLKLDFENYKNEREKLPKIFYFFFILKKILT